MKKLLVAALVLVGCSTTTPPPATTETAAAPEARKAFYGEHGFDLAGMDSSVKACDDFYRFAVGKWRDTHPLPAQYARFGRFEELAERNRETLRAILEKDSTMIITEPGSTEQKLGDFYAACMNEEAIEAEALTALRPILHEIDTVSDRSGLVALLNRLHREGYAPLFRVSGTNDFKNSKMVIAALGTGSLGLPDRDYYLLDDARFKTTRAQYTDHIANMFVLGGASFPAAKRAADRVVALETKLAAATLPRVEARKPENIYNPTTMAELAKLAPAVEWTSYLRRLGVEQEWLTVAQPKYIAAANDLLGEVPLEDWKAYLRWTVLSAAAPTLSRAFVEEDFNFNGRTLSGQKEMQERWKRCVRASDLAVGQLLGQEYVRRNFTPEAKAKMNALIDNLIAALREDIPTLSWMGAETKAAALAKLDAFQRKIGYPDKWRDYSALTIGRASYARNAIAARAWSFSYNIARIGKPDDPDEWGFFTPPTVNASYNPTRNVITFPAGILQPPFYDPNADDAYNYGGIGTVIGHEMTHGFDDQGAKFDAEGNLRNWWSPEDLKNFNARTDCIATAYGEFNVVPASEGQPAININGKLVTGEATADLGGATLALRAYQKSLTGKKRETIDGFTPEQRFFLGFAQVWGENMAQQEATRRALTDPHAQGPFRVNGTVQNMPDFHKAFGCREKDKMVREASKRCAIW